MSQDSRKYDDLFPDWEFSEPDWLKDEPVSFTKETPPEPKPEPNPAPVRETTTPKTPDPFWDSPLPQASPEPVRRTAGNNSWEQTRSSGHSRQSTPARRAAAPSKKREQSRRSPLVIVLIVILIGGMIFAGWQLGSILLGYQRDRSAYDQLATSALISIAEPENNDRPAVSTPSAQLGEDPAETEDSSEETVPSEIPFTVDWDYLASVNPDIAGWLYCPDTVINYPVVQSEDHEYYLNHGFEGQTNSSGTLFADRDSVAGITQSHLIIYGHNMKDNSMFGILRNYTDRDYFEDHPIFYYLTPDDCYRVELICAMTVESVLSNFPTYFSSTGDYQSYLDRITSGAYWVNSSAVTTDHQLITFSTCTYGSGYNDARLLVHGMMIPIE